MVNLLNYLKEYVISVFVATCFYFDKFCPKCLVNFKEILIIHGILSGVVEPCLLRNKGHFSSIRYLSNMCNTVF